MPKALSYHNKVADHFRQQAKTWEFFAAGPTREDQLARYKNELLKQTYQFDPVADARLFDLVKEAKEKLQLQDLAVFLYQAQFSEEGNASILYTGREAHIVFSGPITRQLDEAELLAIIAHELTHVKLFTLDGGMHEVAGRILSAMANHTRSEAAHVETARLHRLYTEIFCDRGAYAVLGNTAPVITSLVKLATGLEKISAESYIRQAEQIFSADRQLRSDQVTHPENFIRARALHLWATEGEGAEAEIERMMEGEANLDTLDIFRQQELATTTRRFLQLLLKPKWFRTPAVLAQARQFFPDFAPDEEAVLNEDWVRYFSAAHTSIREYFGYILLDFALVDKALEDVPMGWVLQLGEDLQLKETMDALLKKEFAFSDKKLQQHKQKMLAAYHDVKESAAEQVYEDDPRFPAIKGTR